MVAFIKSMFGDGDGNISSTRVMAFEIVNAGIIIALFAAFSGNVNIEMIGLASTMITLGLTGKVIQHRTETNGGKTETEGSAD